MKKILIIRLSSMGDVVLTTSLVAKLRHFFPEDQIDFLVASQFSEILLSNPRINNVIQYNKRLDFFKQFNFKKQALKKLHINKYDIIIDLQNNLRSSLFRWRIYNRLYKFDKRRKFKYDLVKKKKRIRDFDLIPDLYISAINELFPENNFVNPPLEVWLPNENIKGAYLSEKPIPPLNKIIAVAPGAKHFTKRMPADKFISVVRKLMNLNGSYKFYFIGGPADTDIILDVAAMIPDSEICINSSIIETCKILDKAALLITNDTGVMHLAAARQVPVLSIFGSTVAELGFIPYKVPNKIAEVNNLMCRPCTHIGRASCPEGHFKCMLLQNEDQIVSYALDLLNNN